MNKVLYTIKALLGRSDKAIKREFGSVTCMYTLLVSILVRRYGISRNDKRGIKTSGEN